MVYPNNAKSGNENWSEVRGKIKAKFGKLTDESIDSLKGNLDQLSAKLQSAYGYAKEKADSELAAFKASLVPASESAMKVLPTDPKSPPNQSASV